MSNESQNQSFVEVARYSGKGYDLERLRTLQERIATKVVIEDRFKKPIKRVAGFDVTYLDDEAIAAAVTMDHGTLRVVEEKTTKGKVPFPYIPTFLGFREGPLIIRLAKNLKLEPDVIMVNSHGIAHPLFCGCASHVGVSLGKATIGVAGSKLCGEYEGKPEKVGDWVSLKHRERIVGAVLLSKPSSRPIFVSVGHMVTLKTAVEIVKYFLTMHKFPEPVRLAHKLANRTKKEAST